jgi:hypothetical protein
MPSPHIEAAAASTRTEGQVRDLRRYCADCRFFVPASHDNEVDKLRFARCGHDSAGQPPTPDRFISRVLDSKAENKFCVIARDHGPCGERAKFFEPNTEVVAA